MEPKGLDSGSDLGEQPAWRVSSGASALKNTSSVIRQTTEKIPAAGFGCELLRTSIRLLAAFLMLAHQIAGQQLIRQGLITANTSTGLPTSMPGDVADVSVFRLSSTADSSPLFGYTAETHNPCPAGFGTKLFRIDGAVVGQFACGPGTTVSAIVLKNDISFFLFYKEAATDNSANSMFYQLQFNLGLYSVDTSTNVKPTYGNIGSALGDDNTDYVYYFTDDNLIARYNQNPPSGPPDPELSSTLDCPSPRSVYFFPTSSSTIVHYSVCSTPKIVFILKTDLSVSKTLLPPSGGGEGAYTHTMNNLNAAEMYVAGSAKLYVYDVGSSTTEWSVLGTLEDYGAVSNVIKSTFINFGTFGFMGCFFSTGTWPFQIYYKSGYSKVPTSVYPWLYRNQYVDYSLLGPVPMPNSQRFIISFIWSGGFNMQSAWFDIDTCTSRTASVCSACPTGSYLNVVGAVNNWCYKEGFGVNPAIVAPAVPTDLSSCADPLCAVCVSTPTCTKCKRSTPQPLIYNNACVYPPPIKYGTGATEYWELCTVTYCDRCTADKTYCTSCDPLSKTTAYNGLCIGPPNVQIGWGADWITGFAKPCNTSNCLDCYLDYQFCLICDKSKEYYLEGTWCKYYADIADFKGGDPDSGLVVKCMDRGCVDCKRNYTICKKCNVPLTYYLDDWYCVLYVDIPYGKGVDAAGGALKKCNGPFCRDCFADYQVCMACDYTTGYFRHNKTCINFQKLEQGVGANLGTGIVEPCVAEGCVVCNANYKDCTTCNADEGWITSNGGCTFNYEPSYVTFGFWDPTAKIVKVSFNIEPVYIPSFEAVFKELFIFDTKTGISYNSDQLNGQLTKSQFGFTIKFESNVTILSGLLNIPQSSKYRILDKSARLVFNAYPIQVSGIYLVPPTASTQSASTTLDSASQSRSLLTLAIFSFNPMVAVALDYMFNELFVLKLYEGPFMAYPELILKTSAQSGILPFTVPNYLESGIEDGECVPSESFQTNDMNCVFLDNYGEDLQSLMGLLSIGLFFSLVTFLFRLCLKPKPGHQKGGFLTVIEFINLNYGLQLFHAKMEGEKLEVMLHVMLGMKHRKQAVKYMTNLVFIIIIQMYYWTVSILGVSFSAEVGRFLTRSPVILTLLQEYKAKQALKTSQEQADPNRQAQNSVISRQNEVASIMAPDSWAVPLESLFSRAHSAHGSLRMIPEYPVAVEHEEFEEVSPPESGDVPHEWAPSENGSQQSHLDQPQVSQHSGISPAGIYKAPESELHGKWEESDTTKQQIKKVKQVRIQNAQVEVEDKSHKIYELKPMPTNEDILPLRSPNPLSKMALLQKEDNSQAFKQMVRFGTYLKRKGTLLDEAVKKRAKSIIPQGFRPEAKEYMELEDHQFRQISFFVAENTITLNNWYQFAPLMSFFRATLLSLIVTKIIGTPTTQISCGLTVEVLYLIYLVKSKYKSSLLEHWVEVVLQSLQVAYLSQKLFSIFDILSDQLKQDYLGLPMAITLGLIAAINVLFVVYNMLMIIWELGELIWHKIRASWKKN